jgi:hypothetical protein
MARRILDWNWRRLVSGCLRRLVSGIARLLSFFVFVFVVALIGVRFLPDPSRINRAVPGNCRREEPTGREEFILPHIFLTHVFHRRAACPMMNQGATILNDTKPEKEPWRAEGSPRMLHVTFPATTRWIRHALE